MFEFYIVKWFLLICWGIVSLVFIVAFILFLIDDD